MSRLEQDRPENQLPSTLTVLGYLTLGAASIGIAGWAFDSGRHSTDRRAVDAFNIAESLWSAAGRDRFAATQAWNVSCSAYGQTSQSALLPDASVELKPLGFLPVWNDFPLVYDGTVALTNMAVAPASPLNCVVMNSGGGGTAGGPGVLLPPVPIFTSQSLSMPSGSRSASCDDGALFTPPDVCSSFYMLTAFWLAVAPPGAGGGGWRPFAFPPSGSPIGGSTYVWLSVQQQSQDAPFPAPLSLSVNVTVRSSEDPVVPATVVLATAGSARDTMAQQQSNSIGGVFLFIGMALCAFAPAAAIAACVQKQRQLVRALHPQSAATGGGGTVAPHSRRQPEETQRLTGEGAAGSGGAQSSVAASTAGDGR